MYLIGALLLMGELDVLREWMANSIIGQALEDDVGLVRIVFDGINYKLEDGHIGATTESTFLMLKIQQIPLMTIQAVIQGGKLRRPQRLPAQQQMKNLHLTT